MDDHHDDHGAGRRTRARLPPLQVLAFATLPPQYRTDGTSLFSLFRNIGSAVGVSVTSSMLAHNTQVLHEQIGASITPFNRALQGGGMISRAWNPMHPYGAALMDQLVNRQALITAYIDDYWMMIFTTLPALALLFLLSRPKLSSPAAGKAHAAID
jgi:MFS transporter, DHA2 family, multidrug resistance protein